jgi:hypothetical protein
MNVTDFDAERPRLTAIAAGILGSEAVFHVEAGLVREVELIADPDVLATIDVVRARVRS